MLFLQESAEDIALLDNTKFWLKFAAGNSNNNNSSVLTVELPICTTIASKDCKNKSKMRDTGNV